jgi:opacity protein-like surface antigen
MKKVFFIVVFVFTMITMGQSQAWKRYPASIFYANGTNHFLGDLGGGKLDASHFLSFRDIDYQATRPTWQLGYRYRFHEYFVFKLIYTYALISGNDQSSGAVGRKARNLSFRSGIYELTGQLEYYFIKEKGVAKTSFGSLRAFSPLSAYVFLGLGGLYFNPKAKDPATGKWIALQPLGTEGQYANPDGSPFSYKSRYSPYEDLKTPKPYSRIAGVIALGLGVKYDINKLWAVGLEISNRYTSSDYLDDTHDRYFNYSDFGLKPPSPYTTVFSDRHKVIDYSTNTITDEQAEPYHSGKTMRGDPKYNDAYILTMITVYYRLGSNAMVRRPKFR